ncbi:MAG: hypothetical protein GYA16_06240 [Spirochaetes bacterium]|nr:hypothetical protein [Spirochaetota bacterium]HOM10579.1 hypothetical protein [Spirochaetota bacterium]HPP49186.1 hypothetical protein [Spirochaetota bacterium]
MVSQEKEMKYWTVRFIVQICIVPGNGGLWKTPTGYIDIFLPKKKVLLM